MKHKIFQFWSHQYVAEPIKYQKVNANFPVKLPINFKNPIIQDYYHKNPPFYHLNVLNTNIILQEFALLPLFITKQVNFQHHQHQPTYQ